MKQTISLLFFLLLFASCGQDKSKQQTTSSNAASDTALVETAKEAYLFGLPLVLMDITRRQMIDPAIDPGAVAENTFYHKSEFPDASFRNVVRPNADTYYSTASINLAKEPLVLSVPNTNDRYYMLPMLDAYTNIFASPGKRTTGTEAGNFLLTGPQWSGTIPEGMKEIKAPTNMVWLIGRTQVNSKEDGAKVVVPIQKQYKLTPLSAWGKPYTPPAAKSDPSVPKGSPNEVVKNMSIDAYFNYLNQLLKDNPPPAADKAAMDKFAAIGIKPGETFDFSSLPPNVQAALKNLPNEIFAGLGKAMIKPGELVNGWSPVKPDLANFGTDYVARAATAYFGLGANLAQDAVYPSCSADADGNKLNGANNYVIHFDKGQTPPANAFWSLTMYDPEGYMVANPINRNAIGDRSNLKPNPDGSIDIYIQHTSPGKGKESNWLPAPAGDFNILLRVYWPKEEMINGTWKMPPVKKVV